MSSRTTMHYWASRFLEITREVTELLESDDVSDEEAKLMYAACLDGCAATLLSLGIPQVERTGEPLVFIQRWEDVPYVVTLRTAQHD